MNPPAGPFKDFDPRKDKIHTHTCFICRTPTYCIQPADSKIHRTVCLRCFEGDDDWEISPPKPLWRQPWFVFSVLTAAALAVWLLWDMWRMWWEM